MAAAKFSLKARGLITPVYGALTSAWKGEISEQGSKTRGRKPPVSQKRKLAPRPTCQAFHCSYPLDSRHRGSSLAAELPWKCPAQWGEGGTEEGQTRTLPWQDSQAGGEEQGSDPGRRALVGVGRSLPELHL